MAAPLERGSTDWTQLLLPELIQEIADHVAEIPDRFRFRAVCTKWSSVSLSKKPHQFPWLHLPYLNSSPGEYLFDDSKRISEKGGDLKLDFLSISEENRLYSIPQPEIQTWNFCRVFLSPNGWLVKVTSGYDDSFLLLNPITRFSTSLPSRSISRRRPGGVLRLILRQFAFGFFEVQLKVLGRGSDLVVVLVDFAGFHFCRPGDSSWSTIDVGGMEHVDFSPHNGCFLFFDKHTRITRGFDMGSCELVLEIPSIWGDGVQNEYSCNFVELPSGELLLVMRENNSFEAYRLDGTRGEGNLRWAKVTSIGNCRIFLDSGNAVCVDSTGFEGYRGNCIFFLDKASESEILEVKVFDIGKGQAEGEPAFSFHYNWDWGQPRWFLPSLC